MKPRYTYACELIRVIDGDTVELNVDLGFSVWTRVTLRLDGINCAELDAASVDERALAAQAKAHLGDILWQADDLVVETKFIRSFARYVGRIYIGGDCVNAMMIDSGFAVASGES